MRTTNYPLVSIVTPSYNQARYLEYTIQSVLRQDYPHIEYLIVDGGSTDDSVDIIKKYAPRLSWWTSQPDSGQAEAINKGLSRARGEILAWLNSDDMYLPGVLSQAVKAFESYPQASMVYGDAITVDEVGHLLNALVFGDWGLKELMAFRIICQPAVFMRRTALDQAGLLDESYHCLLDHHLWVRLAILAPIQHISAFWAAARFHPAAKNVAQASLFGQEALRLASWMGDQPELAHLLSENLRQVWGGAHRLNARYLLDGGKAGPALLAYGKALRENPKFAFQHWHRMLFALVAWLGGGRIARQLAKRYLDSPPPLTCQHPEWKNWPGLCLEA
ncbi:MAG: glycosyltransferase family 2 protein [Chloroflexota bacterium]